MVAHLDGPSLNFAKAEFFLQKNLKMKKKVKNNRFGNSLFRPKAKKYFVENLDLSPEAISNDVMNETFF